MFKLFFFSLNVLSLNFFISFTGTIFLQFSVLTNCLLVNVILYLIMFLNNFNWNIVSNFVFVIKQNFLPELLLNGLLLIHPPLLYISVITCYLLWYNLDFFLFFCKVKYQPLLVLILLTFFTGGI